ncbi:MAG: LysE/ArgO family amino acid transporter [Paracoccaceae bacterium]
MPAALTGFWTGLSLILAIGAQNAFVLRQGLMRAHVFWICLVCALSDAALIALGVLGMGAAIEALPGLNTAIMLAGAAFLIVYGAMALRRALRPGTLDPASEGTGSLAAALATCLALTWLNPHVYIDTVVLMGAISVPFAEAGHGAAFVAGGATASLVFFFTLGYGARALAPLFAKPVAWRVLDAIVAAIMWSIAAALLLSALG